MILTVPKNAILTESPTSTTWYDENGILYSVYKKGRSRTFEETKNAFEEFKKVLGEKKVCMLIDVTHSSESTSEIRAYAAEELPKLVKAIALVSDSPLGKMLANLFFIVKTQPYPTKMFSNEQDAKEWLKQYL